MKSRFHEAAGAELTEAVVFYENRSPGLGERVLFEVMEAIRVIEDYPQIAAVIDLGVRGKVILGFPYTLMYIASDHEIVILALAHHSRRPGYWIDRLPVS